MPELTNPITMPKPGEPHLVINEQGQLVRVSGGHNGSVAGFSGGGNLLIRF